MVALAGGRSWGFTLLESTMGKLDKLAMVQAAFCLVVTGAAVGCGEDSKPEAKRDAAAERAGDVLAEDSAKTDTLAPTEVAKADVPQMDAPQPDAALHLDSAKLDVSITFDAGQGETTPGETAIDGASVDGGPGDVARADAPPDLDTGAIETGNIDGTGMMDGGGTTMASITFHLDNRGAETVYLRNNCWIPFEVTSVAEGTVYANTFFCACNCADASCTSQVACGPCAPPSGIAIAAGQTKDVAWQARKSALETRTGSLGTYQCVAHVPIATGAYVLAISVYATEADAAAGTNGRVVQQSFVLGTANATIAVPVP